jgi:hypothetical protein
MCHHIVAYGLWLIYVQVRVAAAGLWSLPTSCKFEQNHCRFGDFRPCCSSGLHTVHVLRVEGRRYLAGRTGLILYGSAMHVIRV